MRIYTTLIYLYKTQLSFTFLLTQRAFERFCFPWLKVYSRMMPNIMRNVDSNRCFRMQCTQFLLTSIKHIVHLSFYWHKRFEWFYGFKSAIHKWNQSRTFLAEFEILLRCFNAYISIHPVVIDLKKSFLNPFYLYLFHNLCTLFGKE